MEIRFLFNALDMETATNVDVNQDCFIVLWGELVFFNYWKHSLCCNLGMGGTLLPIFEHVFCEYTYICGTIIHIWYHHTIVHVLYIITGSSVGASEGTSQSPVSRSKNGKLA